MIETTMLLVYGLSFSEVLFVLAVAVAISYSAGIWTGKRIFGRRKKKTKSA
jgi:hypothetical protein